MHGVTLADEHLRRVWASHDVRIGSPMRKMKRGTPVRDYLADVYAKAYARETAQKAARIVERCDLGLRGETLPENRAQVMLDFPEMYRAEVRGTTVRHGDVFVTLFDRKTGITQRVRHFGLGPCAFDDVLALAKRVRERESNQSTELWREMPGIQGGANARVDRGSKLVELRCAGLPAEKVASKKLLAKQPKAKPVSKRTGSEPATTVAGATIAAPNCDATGQPVTPQKKRRAKRLERGSVKDYLFGDVLDGKGNLPHKYV